MVLLQTEGEVALAKNQENTHIGREDEKMSGSS